MSEIVKPTAAALRDALVLSEDLLSEIELSKSPLTNSALKASRLARLLNETDYQRAFEYEAGGYPTTPNGVTADVWKCAELAGRVKQIKDGKGQINSVTSLESIEQFEARIEATKLGISAARDPNISLSSANPNQHVLPVFNSHERDRLHIELREAVSNLGSRRAFIHAFVVRKNLELKYSSVASDAFSRIRKHVDASIGSAVPEVIQKFTAIYDNLESENPEDWSNAVHGCRRVLQELADILFPPIDKPRERIVGGKVTQVRLGPDNYINRLVCFAEDHGESSRTIEIMGSQMSFLGDRLDALFRAAQKGSHATIASRDEADRYVVYTYMLVGDFLRLRGAN